jgi:hypothetical protein
MRSRAGSVATQIFGESRFLRIDAGEQRVTASVASASVRPSQR